jgi:hypothetical protein
LLKIILLDNESGQSDQGLGGSASTENDEVANKAIISEEKCHVKIRSISLKNLPNVERLGKNDPYVTLSFGDSNGANISISDSSGIWRAETTVQENAGSSAHWIYGDGKVSMQFLVSGVDASKYKLSVSVKEYNKFQEHGDLGITEMSISSILIVGTSHVLTGSLQNKTGTSNGGTIEMVFDVSAYVPQGA